MKVTFCTSADRVMIIKTKEYWPWVWGGCGRLAVGVFNIASLVYEAVIAVINVKVKRGKHVCGLMQESQV